MGDVAIRTANQEDIPQLLNLMYQYIVDFYKRPKPTGKRNFSITNFLRRDSFTQNILHSLLRKSRSII